MAVGCLPHRSISDMSPQLSALTVLELQTLAVTKGQENTIGGEVPVLDGTVGHAHVNLVWPVVETEVHPGRRLVVAMQSQLGADVKAHHPEII